VDKYDGRLGLKLLEYLRVYGKSFGSGYFQAKLFLYKYSNILKLSHPSYLSAYEDGTNSVPKRRHIKFRRRGITQKKAHKIQNTSNVINQEYCSFV